MLHNSRKRSELEVYTGSQEPWAYLCTQYPSWAVTEKLRKTEVKFQRFEGFKFKKGSSVPQSIITMAPGHNPDSNLQQDEGPLPVLVWPLREVRLLTFLNAWGWGRGEQNKKALSRP